MPLKKLQVYKFFIKLGIIALLYSVIRYVLDFFVERYNPKFPQKLVYHLLLFLMYFWIPALFMLTLDSIIISLKIDKKIIYKLLITLGLSLLLSFIFFNVEVVFASQYERFIKASILFFILGTINLIIDPFILKYKFQKSKSI